MSGNFDSEYDYDKELTELRQKLAESEAGAAGMRRALEDVADNNRRPFSLHSIRAIAQVALSKTDAGKEMLEIVECARELNDILNDREARDEIDSFTGQPIKAALAALDKKIEVK